MNDTVEVFLFISIGITEALNVFSLADAFIRPAHRDKNRRDPGLLMCALLSILPTILLGIDSEYK